MSNLKMVVDHLKSEKIKERQEGITALRSTFTREDAVYSIEDSRSWLVLYQALFTTVKIEKLDVVKKSGKAASTSAAAERRLAEAATTVRWLVERSVHCLSKRVLTPLLEHIVQMLVHRSELFAPVALDYLKTIRVLLSWTPHLDHINLETWLKLVEVCFNIILEDPINKELVSPRDSVSENRFGEDSMYHSDSGIDDADEDMDDPSTSSLPRKRRRRGHRNSPVIEAPVDNATSRSSTRRIVSLEQIECGSLLALLFCYPTVPFLAQVESSNSEENDRVTSMSVAPALFKRMKRFLECYPVETSLHHDYLHALQSFLSNVSLNCKDEVEDLARSTWDALVSLWGTKNKPIKQTLIGILRTLFPFLTAHPDNTTYSWADGIQKLWGLLNGEAENRWGIDVLSLDSLRFQVSISNREAFIARTFRAGWNFDVNQVLAWAVLELQADCAEKLFQHSEVIHVGTPEASSVSGKRVKREDAVTSLLHWIRTASGVNLRTHNLRILLFIIDRHWYRLHTVLQNDVINVLLQFVSVDEVSTQSWVFLCLAAVAYWDGQVASSSDAACATVPQSKRRGPTVWDPIWTHAVRRANVPIVCRAACHTAYVLIAHSKHLLTSHRILAEIETLAKDLDLQGPNFPYDAVCMFLAYCLRIASQDVRLYRMQLEEKVLSWLLDNWRIGTATRDIGGKSYLPPYTLNDTLTLLGSVCGSMRHTDLICDAMLPHCEIVKVMEEQHQDKIIQDYVLFAQLPEQCTSVMKDTTPTFLAEVSLRRPDHELASPRGRDRRISAFLQKAMESLMLEWEAAKASNTHPTAERVRQSFDAAITVLAFESLQVATGTRSNRRTIQSAGKVVALLAPLLIDSRWTPEERLLILKTFEPLILDGDPGDDGERWEALVFPGVETGIKSRALRAVKDRLFHDIPQHVKRRNLQRIIWESADVQDEFGVIAQSMRRLLHSLIDQTPGDAEHIGEADGFGPIRTTRAFVPLHDSTHSYSTVVHHLVQMCVVFLSVVPMLQCPPGEGARDRELVKIVTDCSEEKLPLLGPSLLAVVRGGILNINGHILDILLRKCGDLLQRYSHAINLQLHILVIDLLKSTLHIWLDKTTITSTLGDHVRDLCAWVSRMMRKKVTFWRVRDLVSQFLTRLLAVDPSQSFWPKVDDDQPIERPMNILLALNRDEDIRVRFRMARFTAQLFTLDSNGLIREYGNLDGFYQRVHDSLPKDLAEYEHILTRSLCLGNIMISSSHVRRGPYWHILEAAFHSLRYARHIQSVLQAVSGRLGLSSANRLFEAYASQIAFSVRQNFYDILRLPPNILGYTNRKACAEAAFPQFTPANLVADGDLDAIAHGHMLFANHCAAVQRSIREGISTCIGELIGLQVVCIMDRAQVSIEVLMQKLQDHLVSMGIEFDTHEAFLECVKSNAAGVAVAIIRSLGDQDFSEDGAISQALRTYHSVEAACTFSILNRYRHLNDFKFHPPNLPRFSTSTILRSLQLCLSAATPEHITAISYHVLHQLFSELHSTPFVNEQLRLLNGITLLVSVRSNDFGDPTLLHMFTQKSSLLLDELDLIPATQSLLEWCFSVYRKTSQVDQHLPDILIRVCALIDSSASSTASGPENGQGLRSWIDHQVLLLAQNNKIRSSILRALPAWSHQPSSDLSIVGEDIGSVHLSTALGDSRITSNKFRLVGRLHQLAEQSEYSRVQFANVDFWRLKDHIPPREWLHSDDIDAFASLLIANAGNIYSFGSEPPLSQTLRGRHRRGMRRKEDKQLDPAPQRVIIHSLIAMLDDSHSSEVNLVYLTLRSLVTAASPETLSIHYWATEHYKLLGYLRTFPMMPVTRPKCAIDQLENISFQDAEFSQWICSITTLLSDLLASADIFWGQFAPLLASNITFAEEIFPVLVHTLLQADARAQTTDLSVQKRLSDYLMAVLRSEGTSRSCLRCVVDVVLHLRNFEPPGSTNCLGHDRWLQVDYHLLAKSAVTCGLYTTALLFLELACEYQQLDMESAEGIEHLLFDIYSHIDEPDGFYGIKITDLRHFLIKRFHHEKQWEKAFRFHGAALEAGSNEAIDANGLLESFHAFGFDHLALGTLQSSQGGFDCDVAAPSMSYQLGWRSGTWDLPETGPQDSSTALYRALRAFHRERDPNAIDEAVHQALCDTMERLRMLGNEDITEIREVSRNLMCLNQLRRWRSDKVQDQLSARCLDVRSLSDISDIDPDFEFLDLERILATRISLVRTARQKEEREQLMTSSLTRALTDLEKRCLVRLSVAARKSNQLQIALNSVVKAQRLETTASWEVSQEFANVLWLQKEQKLAVQFLKDLFQHKASGASCEPTTIDKALVMARLGSWISEACLEKPTDIKDKFFDTAAQAANLMEAQTPSRKDACASVFHKCALFAEHQYQSILKSSDAIRWKVYVDRKKEEIKQRASQLQRTQMGSRDYFVLDDAQTKAKTLLAADEGEYERHNGSLMTFLKLAIDMYSRCLATSDIFDDDVPIRFCSLWFANFDDKYLQNGIMDAVDRIPSRKFVFLSHQLSARISRPALAEVPLNQQILQRLILRMCQEHPFHSLYQVYCIQPEGSSSRTTSSKRSSSRNEPPSSQADRACAASAIFDLLLDDANHTARVKAIEHVCTASLQWAKYPIKSNRDIHKIKGALHVPESVLLRQLRDVRVPVLTSHLSIDPTLKYDDCVWISHYDSTFQVAGGINVPKINICYGSNGQKFKQLFKGEGNDDLRQDAVMEQVFELVNTVLRCDRETKRRDLKVRGYTVLPLAAQAGVIEFVENTVPLQVWLHAAHTRYRPHDMNHRQAMSHLREVREKCDGQAEALVDAFNKICKETKPVMRHYFVEKHKTPMSWFAMRLNYTRSVATTSIVGHILGLGDRHVSNILLDNGTGEVVHIDLGIAFDQGKLLRVPERVPFRMTRDMVDGMGYSGTQGVFQRCAEETLRVLRAHSDIVMTVLEVFKHDPLHSWTASELRLKKIQDSITITDAPPRVVSAGVRQDLELDLRSGTAESADRALSSVARKLDQALSVEYTVNALIAEAKDVVNLATIYHGWSPDF